MSKLNELGNDLTLFVVNVDNQIKGVLTDGDIRRGLLNGFTIEDEVVNIMNYNFHYLKHQNYNIEKIEEYRKIGIKLLPVLNQNFEILEILNISKLKSILPIDVVIMAGGRGERLKPLTDTKPKPMLKIGDKPILEHNIDRLSMYGVKNIFITVRYLSNQIINYFQNGENKNLNIKYIEEELPLGTIGALSLIEEFKNDTILLMNSDVLTNLDFEDFFKSFINESAALSVAAVGYTINIPYAVLETKNRKVISLKEKPSYTYYSNAGIYLIKKDLIKLIPKNKFYNATEFMEQLIQNNEKVLSYQIMGYWLDIGKHEDYKKANEDIKNIKL